MRPWAVVLAAGLLVAGCRSNQAQDVAPNFELKDLSGNTVTLKQFRGHPVLLDFWATWCPPCRFSAPYLDRFYTEHKKQGLIVLGMDVDDDPSVVVPVVKELGTTYPVLLAGQSQVPQDYRLRAFPTFVLIDAQGRIVRKDEGFSLAFPAMWDDELSRLLPQK